MASWTLTVLLDQTLLTFDPGDKSNWSLYLCEAPDGSGSSTNEVIRQLRAAKLWSEAAPKRVADQEKDAYRAQLELLEVREHRVGGRQIMLLRCTHSRFPSDESRWDAWNAVLRRPAS